MILRSPLAFMLLFLGAGTAHAANPVKASVVVHELAIDIDVAPDGSDVTTVHREQSPASLAAAAQIGQFAVNFNPSLERLDLLDAYTRKADDSRTKVDLDAVRSQLAPGVSDVPIFQDLQQKVLVFPDLGAGDTEVLTYRKYVDHPLFPGRFFWEVNFPRTVAWEDVVITITAPANYPLRTESFGPAFNRREQDGKVRYIWHYSAPDVISEDMAELSVWDRLPRIFVSSFPDYRALATAYGDLADPKAAVTPSIHQRADDITAGITDRRAQAQAIYDWVSLHIRYVALYLGAGSVEPHAAELVLKAGYGDCKDHTSLFAALLKAKGIESQTVLVNLDNAYTLSGPPTLAQLNHAISYLPEFDIYADTTPGVAPFGTLPFQEYGKPAVLVPGMVAEASGGAAGATMIADVADVGDIADADVTDALPGILGGTAGTAGKAAPDGLIQLPMLAPDAATMTTRTESHIEPNGAILGTTTTETTGAMAIALRQNARWVQTTGTESAARRLLLTLGQPGTGTFSFDSPEALAPAYVMSGKFKLDARPEILDGESFAPPLGLELLVRPGDYYLGPLNRPNLPATEATPCFPGRQQEDLSLELPMGRNPERLPPDRLIENAQFTYASHWSMDGQTVRVHRELVSHAEQPVCRGEFREQTAQALAEIRRDQRRKIILADP